MRDEQRSGISTSMADGKEQEMTPLHTAFLNFCRFGDKLNTGTMDGSHFLKLCKDSGLVDGKLITTTDVDLTFQKCKEAKKRSIEFFQFKEGLGILALKKYPDLEPREAYEQAVALVVAAAPAAHGTTKAENVSLHDDKTKYTGVSKQGGPTTVDESHELSTLADRSPADARGVPVNKKA